MLAVSLSRNGAGGAVAYLTQIGLPDDGSLQKAKAMIPNKPISLLAALRDFFGMHPGQKISEFAGEMKSAIADDSNRQYYKTELEKAWVCDPGIAETVSGFRAAPSRVILAKRA